MNVAAYLVVYNEEKRIEKVIESFNWVDELHILDKGSSDNTIRILNGYKSLSFIFIYNIPYSDVLEDFEQHYHNIDSKCKWHFFAIASHAIDKSLVLEIKRVTSLSIPNNLIKLPLKMNILGITDTTSPYHAKYKTVLIKKDNVKISNVVHQEVGFIDYNPYYIDSKHGYLHHITSSNPEAFLLKVLRYNKLLAKQYQLLYAKKALKKSLKELLFSIKTCFRNGYLFKSSQSRLLSLCFIVDKLILVMFVYFNKLNTSK